MNNFYIKSLTAFGENKTESTVEFSPFLTIISGASNTGKTFIFKCLNYLFGSNKIDINSNTGYNIFQMIINYQNKDIIFTRKRKSTFIDVNSQHPNVASGKYYIDSKKENWYGTLVMLTNHTPFDDVDKYGEFDVIFGKGTISSTPTSATIGEGQFAIETNEQEVINALAVGKRIKVQAKYESDAMNNVETAAGFHAIHRNNGVDGTIPNYSPNQLNSQYDARQYNRSIFGQTADGTYVLLTADKSNAQAGTSYRGLRYWETNAVLKHFGVTEAYQQDGGGSVTAIMRNANGGIDVVNDPSDSAGKTQRSVFNGLFFVVRDPGFVAKREDLTRTSVNITLKENNLFSQMQNVKVNVNADTNAYSFYTLTHIKKEKSNTKTLAFRKGFCIIKNN